MKFRFILYFLICLTSVHAQTPKQHTISGSVINEKNTPVQGASIYLLNTTYYSITNSVGVFSIEHIPAGTYAIQVSSVGYATLQTTIEINSTAGNSIRIIMKDEALQLDAVYVSAQKKEEFLQRVPISITALTAGMVSDYRLWNSRELTAIVPNLNAANSGDDRNVISIRGIATTAYDPAVTTYIDGVNQFSLDTYIAQLSDIERIEVLRGPQGTLYGRNAMGGVINIITKQPTGKTEGSLEMSMGNYGLFRGQAALRFPIIKNKLFMGVASVFNKRAGFYTNDFDNSSFDRQHVLSNNYYLKFIPGSRLQFTFNVKHQQNNNDGAFPLVNGVADAFEKPFHLNQNAVTRMKDNIFNTSLVAVYHHSRFQFSSTSAYQTNRRIYKKPIDADFSPIDGVTILNDFGGDWNKVKVFTEELKFTSPASSSSPINWTLGSYFFSQDNPTKQAIRFGRDAAYVGAPDTNFSLISTNTARNTGLAFFGQTTLAVTKKLKIIAGLRYDFERKSSAVKGEYQKDPNPVPLFETRSDTGSTVRFNAFSPKLGVSYNLHQQHHLFFTYSRGFRTGGLTTLSSDPSQPPLFPFNPEYSNNFEAGIKSALIKDRVHVNITVFATQVNDAQVPTLILPDAVTVIQNAGKLKSKGVEISIAAKIIRGLSTDYNFGYTDARYSSLHLSQNGTSVNLKGKRQIFTPTSTSMLALQYKYNLNSAKKVTLIARGEWQHLGRQYFNLANTISQGDYSLVNFRCGINSGKNALYFWVRNLCEKRYISYAYDFGAVHLGNPRTLGITLSAGF